MPKPNASPAALRRVLTQQLMVSKRLVALAEEQTEALVASDVARLTDLEKAQRACIDEQERLEISRQTATRDLAWAMGMDRVPTLSALMPNFPPREQEAFSRLRSQLLETQDRLGIVKQRNLYLLENALEYVRFSLDLLTEAALQPARYGTNLAAVAAPTFYIDSKA